MSLAPKNWKSFQHYSDRKPAWIKLHHGLLDDYAFACLPVASRALAPLLWLLASEYDDGKITASEQEIAFRLRLSADELSKAVQPLVDAGFFTRDSEPLAARKQEATLEKEIQEQTQVEKEEDGARTGVRRQRKRAVPLPDDFQPDWSAATRVGLSRSEGSLEFERFRNHAAQTGRTCIDWQAAWRNWCIKAAEMRGREPPKPKGEVVAGYYAQPESPQLDAWDAHNLKSKGTRLPRDRNGGWRVDSEWPPGYDPPQEVAA